jgi:hypothetical protein
MPNLPLPCTHSNCQGKSRGAAAQDCGPKILPTCYEAAMRARLFGLGLWLTSCSAPPIALPPADPTPSPRLRPQPAPVGSIPEPAASPVVDLTLPEATPLVAVPPEPPHLLIEPPYSALGHPRLATEMQTLERDEQLFQWALGGSSDPAHPSNRPGYHPATRVVVDVELLSRAPQGSTKRLLRIARSTGYWPLRACFEAAQRLTVRTERSARVRLTLGASGKVLGSRSLGPTIERDYARCVLERIRGLDFTPGFTRKLDVEISVKQWPGHAPVPPRAPDTTPALHLTSGIGAALEGLAPALLACYERGLTADAKLWGRIALRLQLASDGAVEKAEPVETRFPDAAVTECTRQTVLNARISSPGVSELTFAVRFGQGAPPAPTPPTPEAPPAPSPPMPH